MKYATIGIVVLISLIGGWLIKSALTPARPTTLNAVYYSCGTGGAVDQKFSSDLRKVRYGNVLLQFINDENDVWVLSSIYDARHMPTTMSVREATNTVGCLANVPGGLHPKLGF
jgi:hypothetical protein